MFRRVALAVAAAGVVAATALGATAGATGTTGASTPTGKLVRAEPVAAVPAHGGKIVSANWSGYAVTPDRHDITAVRSSFVVPDASLIPPGFGATWTGIGGYTSGDLIQAGAAEDSAPDNPLLGPQYYAWYELLPAGQTQLTGCAGDPACTVKPGEQINVAITQVGAKQWSIRVGDVGHWVFDKTVTYSSSRSSAEWIAEAPSLDGLQSPLITPLGTVRFGPTSTWTAGGTRHSIAAGDPTQIVLNNAQATPSALSRDGQAFDVCTYHKSCPAP